MPNKKKIAMPNKLFFKIKTSKKPNTMFTNFKKRISKIIKKIFRFVQKFIKTKEMKTVKKNEIEHCFSILKFNLQLQWRKYSNVKFFQSFFNKFVVLLFSRKEKTFLMSIRPFYWRQTIKISPTYFFIFLIKIYGSPE